LENMSLYLVSAFVVFILILNIIATYIVFKTHFVVKGRRLAQSLFIWCIPFLGGLLAVYLNREEYFERRHQRQVGNNTSISHSEAINHAIATNQNHQSGR